MTDNQSSVAYMNKYIANGEKETLMLRNFYETVLVTNPEDSTDMFRVPLNDFFIQYRDELEEAVEYYSLPQSMFYKPKTLSLSLYGTTELWLALLRVNGMRNISEFCYPLIRVYNSSQLTELINIFFKREGKI